MKRINMKITIFFILNIIFISFQFSLARQPESHWLVGQWEGEIEGFIPGWPGPHTTSRYIFHRRDSAGGVGSHRSEHGESGCPYRRRAGQSRDGGGKSHRAKAGTGGSARWNLYFTKQTAVPNKTNEDQGRVHIDCL